MSQRIIIFILGLLICLCLPVGCSNKEEQKPLSPAVKIGICLADMRFNGNQTIKKVLDKRKEKEQVEIIWFDAQNDPEQQEKQIAKLIKRRVKVVVWQPISPEKCLPLVQQLQQKNIKIVILNNLPANAPVDAYVTFDCVRAGQLLGRFVAEALAQAANKEETEKKFLPKDQLLLPARRPLNVLILKGPSEDRLAAEIAAAARISLQNNPEIRLLAEEEFTAVDIHQDNQVIQQKLSAQISKTDVILATDSRLARCAVEAIKTERLTDQVLTAGVGANIEAARAILKGEHDAEVDLMPELMAQHIFDAALSLAKTGHWQYADQVVNGDYNIPAQITPVRLISQANLYLLKERWGKELKKGRSQDQKESQKDTDSSNSKQENSSQDKKEESDSKPKTTLRITTQEGKTMEIQVPGEVKSIETSESTKK